MSKSAYRISAPKRERIYERDGRACVHCGEGDPEKLTVNHKTPRAHGGTTEDSNLETCCYACNQRQSRQLTGSINAGRKRIVQRGETTVIQGDNGTVRVSQVETVDGLTFIAVKRKGHPCTVMVPADLADEVARAISTRGR